MIDLEILNFPEQSGLIVDENRCSTRFTSCAFEVGNRSEKVVELEGR